MKDPAVKRKTAARAAAARGGAKLRTQGTSTKRELRRSASTVPIRAVRLIAAAVPPMPKDRVSRGAANQEDGRLDRNESCESPGISDTAQQRLNRFQKGAAD